MEGGSDSALTIQGDIVLGIGIHQEFDSSRWCGVDQEVDIDIGIRNARVHSSLITCKP